MISRGLLLQIYLTAAQRAPFLHGETARHRRVNSERRDNLFFHKSGLAPESVVLDLAPQQFPNSISLDAFMELSSGLDYLHKLLGFSATWPY